MKLLSTLALTGLAAAKWSPGTIEASDKPLVVLYYDEWAKWSQWFSVYQMERVILSRQMPVRNWVINYSFLTYSPQSCKLVPTDNQAAWSSAETQMFPGSAWWTQGSKDGVPAGAMPALSALRQKYPYIKFLFSVGGWSMSHTFSDCVRTGVDDMVDSAVDFVHYFDFDGIDLDWEYPECELDAPSSDPKKSAAKCGCQGEPICYDMSRNFFSPNKAQEGDWEYYKVFVKKLRTALDALEDKMQKKLYVTAAIGMSPKFIDGKNDTWKVPLPIEWICDEDDFDWVNLMTYDFYGPWTPKTGHLTPLYKSTGKDADEVQISIDESIQKVLARCSRPEKLTMGLAAYGKGWSNVPSGGATVPGLWQSAEHKHPEVVSQFMTYGPWMTYERGTIAYWDIKYNYLTSPNCKRTYDTEVKAPTLYCTRIPATQAAGEDDLANNVFITYDDGESWADRMAYARKHGMAGAIIWAASGSGHEAFTDHSGRYTTTHDGVEDLYNGLFKGWYGYDNKIGAIGASGRYTFKGLSSGGELPLSGSTCPYGDGSWRNTQYVYNACYDNGKLWDYQNTQYPKKTGSGEQDLVGKDVVIIGKATPTQAPASTEPTPAPTMPTPAPTMPTTKEETKPAPVCTLPPECNGQTDTTTTTKTTTTTTTTKTTTTVPKPATTTTTAGAGSGGLEECQKYNFAATWLAYCRDELCKLYAEQPIYCPGLTTLQCVLQQATYCAP